MVSVIVMKSSYLGYILHDFGLFKINHGVMMFLTEKKIRMVVFGVLGAINNYLMFKFNFL